MLLEKAFQQTILLLVLAFFMRPQVFAQEPPLSNAQSSLPLLVCLGANDAANEGTTTSNCQDQAEPQQAGPPHKTGVPLLRDAEETAWSANVEYYAPYPGFSRANRDIDVSDIRAAYAWRFPQGWELQLGGLFFRAIGNRTVPSPSPTAAQEDSSAVGGAAGPLLRWNFLQFRRWRLFAEAEEDLLITNNNFPSQGSSYNGYFRGGGGISIQLKGPYWLEADFHFAHVSDARELQDNPIWNGRGFSLGLRHAGKPVSASPAESAKRSALPILRYADETAWLTTLDYYAPWPGFNRQNRDIDVGTFGVNRAWHFRRGLEFQFGGLGVRASGTRTIDPAPAPVERSDALGVGFDSLGRWNFFQRKQCRLFAEAEPGFTFTNNGFPSGGTQYNFFLRAGGGAALRLNRGYWLETSYRWTQISNAQGAVPGNPVWQGQGIALALRHALQVE
jgi:hypothetical protein